MDKTWWNGARQVLRLLPVLCLTACGSESPDLIVDRPVAFFTIAGQGDVPPGTTVQLRAILQRLPGGDLIEDVTQETHWQSSDPAVVSIDPGGAVTALALGEARIDARYGERRASRMIVTTRPGSYVWLGMVRAAGSGLPLAGAQVEVTGTSLSTVTDASGRYRLSEVPPGAEMVARRDGFEPSHVRPSILGTEVDFDLRLISPAGGPAVNLAGTYTLRVGGGPCQGSAPPLPAALATRTYTAHVTQEGSSIEVALSHEVPPARPRFGFTGSSHAEGVARFCLGAFCEGDPYFAVWSVDERLPEGTLIVEGMAIASVTGDGLSGTFDGILRLDGTGLACASMAHTFTLARH